VLLIEEKKHY